MRNKWPKHARENREISARLMHPDRTRVTQLLKYQNHHKCIVHGIRNVRRIFSYLVQGVTDESKIYGRHYAKIVIYPEKRLHIYYDH